MEITLISNFFNEEENIPHFLESLHLQSDRDFTIIMVDDFSHDESVKNIMSYKKDLNITVTSSPKKGISFAKNHALELAKSNYVVCVDVDEIFPVDYIKNIKAFLTRNPQVFFAVWKILPHSQSLFSKSLRNIIELSWNRNSVLKSGNMILYKPILQKIGGLPIGILNEDSILTECILQAWYHVQQIENIEVFHKYCENIVCLSRRDYIYGLRDAIAWKQINISRAWTLIVLFFPMYYVIFLYLLYQNKARGLTLLLAAGMLYILVLSSSVGYIIGKLFYHR
jgi:glycosyltransferase involved in cell wall biosynthesis